MSLAILGLVIEFIGQQTEYVHPVLGAGWAYLGALAVIAGMVLILVSKRQSAEGWSPHYAPPPGSVGARTCPSCGAGNWDRSQYCHMCGQSLPAVR